MLSINFDVRIKKQRRDEWQGHYGRVTSRSTVFIREELLKADKSCQGVTPGEEPAQLTYTRLQSTGREKAGFILDNYNLINGSVSSSAEHPLKHTKGQHLLQFLLW